MRYIRNKSLDIFLLTVQLLDFEPGSPRNLRELRINKSDRAFLLPDIRVESVFRIEFVFRFEAVVEYPLEVF